MAKKKKPTDPIARMTLRISMANRRDAMIERCKRLRDGGKLEQARQLFAKIERLTEEINEL